MNLPRRLPQLVFIEQVYRGEPSYIVKDPERQKYFRFRPVEVVVMQQFDGEHTSGEIAQTLADQGLPFTAVAVEGFARKLGHMGLLERTVAEKSVLLLERLRAERRRRLKGTHYTGSLLRMRWSVGDPDRFFDRWLPRLRLFFSPTFLWLSVLLFLVYGIVAAARWPELSHAIGQLLTPSSYTVGSFLLLYATALVVIGVHELGHGFTCKYFGGHVHEMGAMLIYFQPAFYCNVNDAWTFSELRARLWVTAAGSWIQLAIAGIAAIVWWAATPATLAWQIALYAVVIGGITTVLANANPLIPLDGYYALSDWLEIPNLRDRAFGYLTWLVKRHVLRLELPQPAADERERRIFIVYGLLAVVYSTTILVLVAGAIFGWVNRTLGALGVLAFLIVVWAMAASPMRGWTQSALTAVREHRATWRSGRLWRRVGVGAAILLLVGFLIPWPINVGGRFQVTPAPEFALQTPDSALVIGVAATEGMIVAPGTGLVQLKNFDLDTSLLAARRRADSLAALEVAAMARGVMDRAGQLTAERSAAQAVATQLEARVHALSMRAPIHGVVLTPRLEEAVGRWMPPGAVVVRLGGAESVEVRIRLDRAGASLVAPGQRVALYAYLDGGHALEAQVTSVASVGTADELEARVRIARAGTPLVPGASGEAKVSIRRSNVWGAFVWAIRKRVRSDLLL